jgi:hypothetical protein
MERFQSSRIQMMENGVETEYTECPQALAPLRPQLPAVASYMMMTLVKLVRFTGW